MTRILVAEDNPTNMELALEILRSMGFIVRGAKDGNIALMMAEKESYDVVVLDIEMPGKNGVEVLNILRSMPKYKDVPAIALTAYAMKGDRERFLEAGFNKYFPKPLDVVEFMRAMEKYKD